MRERDLKELVHAVVGQAHPKFVGQSSGLVSQVRVNVFPFVYFCFVASVLGSYPLNHC